MKVYHLLPPEYGLQAVARRRLKIARIHELNDPFEWAPPSNCDKYWREAFNRMKDKSSKIHGIICFSGQWQNPVIWSHYAAKHTGLSLGFEIDDDPLQKVKYQNSRPDADFEKLESDEEYGVELVSQLGWTKFKHWEYEDEYRFGIRLDHATSELGLYFLDFDESLKLKEVIVGANSELSRKNVEAALGSELSTVMLTKARLAFQDFKVVHQRDAALW